MIEHQVDDRARELALLNYMQDELDLTEQEALSVDIVRTFMPKNTGRLKMMYIEFPTIQQKSKVSSRAIYLRTHKNPDKQDILSRLISDLE